MIRAIAKNKFRFTVVPAGMLAICLVAVLAITGCNFFIGGYNSGNGGDLPIPPGPTSPDAVVKRLEKYLPREAYEKIFDYRFGTDKWLTMATNPVLIANRHDYYSYDNLKKAVYELAYLVYEIEFRTEPNGDTSHWNSRAFVTNKGTGKRTLVYEEAGFSQDQNLNKPITTTRVDFGSFLGEGSENDRKREIIALLANMTQETSGGNGHIPGDREKYGLFFNEEMGLEGSTGANYVDPSNAQFPPAANRSYHGRGPIQLSWNYNYGLYSAIVFQDKNVLLQAPEKLVAKDGGGVLGFKSSIWFWMTPQAPKPSCHDVILSTWKPNTVQAGAGWKPGFGATIMVINGGLEGGFAEGSDYRVNTRIGQYRRLAKETGANIAGEKVDTAGMSAL